MGLQYNGERTRKEVIIVQLILCQMRVGVPRRPMGGNNWLHALEGRAHRCSKVEELEMGGERRSSLSGRHSRSVNCRLGWW